MALSSTVKIAVSGVNASSGTPYTTASFTPSNNSLLVLCINELSSLGNGQITWSVSGGGLTWTKRVGSNSSGNPDAQSEIWTAPVVTGASLTVTITPDSGKSIFSADGTASAISVTEFTGQHTSPIGLSGTSAANASHSGALAISLGGTTASDSAVLITSAADGDYGDVLIDSGTGYTDLHKTSSGTSGWFRSTTAYKIGALSNGDFSSLYTNFQYATAALEIKAAAGVTWNPSDKHANITLSNGDKTAAVTSGGSFWNSVRANAAKTGKLYFEIEIVARGDVGVLAGFDNGSLSLDNFCGNTANSYALYNSGFSEDGGVFNNGSYTDLGNGATNGQVVGIAFDTVGGKAYYAVENVYMGSMDPAAGTNGQTITAQAYYPCATGGINAEFILRTVAADLTYSPPSGFSAFDPADRIIDDIGVSAYRAAGLRKLRTAYAGSAIRVQRSSDSAEQDIVFDINGDLDTAALLTFVGAGTGYVVKIYDQSGNGRDWNTKSTTNNWIVSSGSLVTKNGKPAIRFTSSGGFTSTGAYSEPLTTLLTVESDDLSDEGIIGGDGGSQYWYGFDPGVQRYVNIFNHGVNSPNSLLTANTMYAGGVRVTSTAYRFWHNGSVDASGSQVYGVGAGTTFHLGTMFGFSAVNGYIQEVLEWNSALSDAQGLIGNQDQYDYWIAPSTDPLHLYDYALDFGLNSFLTLANKIVVCNALPTTYTEANSTFKIGEKDFGVGNVIASGPIAASPSGRKVTTAPVINGTVTSNGTPTHWAIIDDANSRLFAAGDLTDSEAVTTSDNFLLDAFTINVPAGVA